MAPRYRLEENQLLLSPRDLLMPEFPTERTGTQVGERVQSGRESHWTVAERRASANETYQREVPLTLELEIENAKVEVFARIDGLFQEESRTIAEEIKSALRPENLPRENHIEQLTVYLWMLSQTGREELLGQLTYIFPDGTEKSFAIELDEVADSRYRQRIKLILAWHRQEAERLRERSQRIDEIKWPFGEYREGQEDLEATVRDTVSSGRCLLLEAPTGWGKTAPILFGAISESLQTGYRLHVTTSRTAQQQGRIDFIRSLGPTKAVGRVQLLGSRETLGLDPLSRSDPLPFDRYDPPDWLIRLVDSGEPIVPETVKRVAAEKGVDAGSLQRELARYSDVLIGDLNILALPGSPYLGTGNNGPERDIVLLVDEAHGLPDRLRDRESTVLATKTLRNVAALLEKSNDPLAGTPAWLLGELADRMEAVLRGDSEAYDLPQRELITLSHNGIDRIIQQAIPALESMGEFHDVALVKLYRSLRLLSLAAVSQLHDLYLDRNDRSFHLELIETGPLFSATWELCKSVLAFSATLTPAELYKTQLGFPHNRTRVETYSDSTTNDIRPVFRYTEVDTTFRRREETLPLLAEVLAGLAKKTQGRWIVFFPSRAYMEAAERELGVHTLPVTVLRSGMPPALLNRMIGGIKGPSLLLALMGGKIGEGMDLPQGEFHGAVIIGPGTPPPSPRAELLRERTEERGDDGRFAAYFLPGLIRARQAAGRLLRDPEQSGALVLVGKRYADERFEPWLPPDWGTSEVIMESDILFLRVGNWWRLARS